MKRPIYQWRPLREGPPWTLEIWYRNLGIFIVLLLGAIFLFGWLTGWK